MAQDAPSPGAALFQKLFVRTHEAATEEAQLPALFELFAATHRSTGSNYLNALAVHLTELLNVDLCLITRAEVVDLKQVQAVAHARQGKSEPLVGYSPAGTPCEIVLQGAEYHVADNLIETFPAYKLLEERGYRSYFGVPLWGENEEVIGQICLLDDKPMIDPSFARDIVCMFAPQRNSCASSRAKKWMPPTNPCKDFLVTSLAGSTDTPGLQKEKTAKLYSATGGLPT